MKGYEETTIRVVKKCKRCNFRLLDKLSMGSCIIEIKCPRCGEMNKVNLAYRMTSPVSSAMACRAF